ncbi:MAG: fibronectin type III domain-containing protein [Candidatus Muiribacteriaceae bacterium]
MKKILFMASLIPIIVFTILTGCGGSSGGSAPTTNNAPSISSIVINGDSGDIDISFQISDTEGDLSDVTVRYETGGTEYAATDVTGNTSLAPGTHTITWDSTQDIAGNLSDVRVILQAVSGTHMSEVRRSSEFNVLNDFDAANGVTNITAQSKTDTQIVLAWTAPANGASSYKVRYSGGTEYTTTSTTYTFDSLTASTAYEFTVTAVKGDGTETPINHTIYTDPPKPVINQYMEWNISDVAFTVHWDYIQNISTFEISVDGTVEEKVPGTETNVRITGKVRDTEYTVKVKAIGNLGDESEWSDAFTVGTGVIAQPLRTEGNFTPKQDMSGASSFTLQYRAMDFYNDYLYFWGSNYNYDSGSGNYYVDRYDPDAENLENLMKKTWESQYNFGGICKRSGAGFYVVENQSSSGAFYIYTIADSFDSTTKNPAFNYNNSFISRNDYSRGLEFDGNSVWLNVYNNADHTSTLYELNPADGSHLSNTQTLPKINDIAWDGTSMWSAGDDNKVYKMNGTTAESHNIYLGDGVTKDFRAIAVDPAGPTMYLMGESNNDQYDIYSVDMNDFQ